MKKRKFYGKYEKKKILWNKKRKFLEKNIEKMNFYCSTVIILLYVDGGTKNFWIILSYVF